MEAACLAEAWPAAHSVCSEPSVPGVTHALLSGDQDSSQSPNLWFSNQCVPESPGGLFKLGWLSPTPRVSDSIGLGRAQAFAVLLSSQVILLVCGTTVREPLTYTSMGLSINLAICSWASVFSFIKWAYQTLPPGRCWRLNERTHMVPSSGCPGNAQSVSARSIPNPWLLRA